MITHYARSKYFTKYNPTLLQTRTVGNLEARGFLLSARGERQNNAFAIVGESRLRLLNVKRSVARVRPRCQNLLSFIVSQGRCQAELITVLLAKRKPGPVASPAYHSVSRHCGDARYNGERVSHALP